MTSSAPPHPTRAPLLPYGDLACVTLFLIVPLFVIYREEMSRGDGYRGDGHRGEGTFFGDPGQVRCSKVSLAFFLTRYSYPSSSSASPSPSFSFSCAFRSCIPFAFIHLAFDDPFLICELSRLDSSQFAIPQWFVCRSLVPGSSKQR